MRSVSRRVFAAGVCAALSSAGCMRWGYDVSDAPLSDVQLGGTGASGQLDGAGGATARAAPDVSMTTAGSDAGGAGSVLEPPDSSAAGNGGSANSGGSSATGSAGSSAGGAAGTGPSSDPPCATWSAFGTPEPLTGFGFTGNFWGPGLSSDGLTLYFSSDVGSSEDLYVASRSDRGNVFSTAAPLSELNTTALESNPSLSADGLSLYFASARPGSVGDRDLMVATRPDPSSPFANPTWLSELNTVGREQTPELTPDQKTIVFSTDGDLFIAERSTPTDPFGPAQAMTGINSGSPDSGAAFSADGLVLYFTSQRTGGSGSWDIWVSTRPDRASAFTAAFDVQEVNSNQREIDPELSADGSELIFARFDTGPAQLWHATRTCQ
jgi:Tol biopolymer transport system component